MQPSLGILPVYCYSTSGVYHTYTHAHTHTLIHTEPEREGVYVCVHVWESETELCGVSLISASMHEHVPCSCGLLVKSHKYAALIPWLCVLRHTMLIAVKGFNVADALRPCTVFAETRARLYWHSEKEQERKERKTKFKVGLKQTKLIVSFT